MRAMWPLTCGGVVAIALASPAAAGKRAPRVVDGMLLLADYSLPPATRARPRARWTLPDVAERYDPPRAPKRLRLRGKKLKWRLPLG